MTKYSVQPADKHKAKGIATNFFIRIEEGPYERVEYTYTKVEHRGLDKEDNMKIRFEYDVLYSPVSKVVQADFEAVLWEILKEILIESADAIPETAKEPEVEVLDELEEKPIIFRPEEIIPESEST